MAARGDPESAEPFARTETSPVPSSGFAELQWTKSENTTPSASSTLLSASNSSAKRKYFRMSRHATNYDHEPGVRIAKWGLTWIIPSQMVGLYLLGILGAVLHHVYNSKLDGQPAENQDWAQRLGSALAFFTKMCFVGAVGFAYRQRVWHVLREKAISVAGIDNLFNACGNPFSLLDPEMLWRAKLSSLLAIVSWTIPLAAIFSPGTLTTATTSLSKISACDVPALVFSEEISYNYYTNYRYSMAFYNSKTDGNYAYQGPSTQLKRTASLTLLSSIRPVQAQSPCSGIENCTYTLEYYGPAYKCTDLSADAASNTAVKLSDIAPKGNYVYMANEDENEADGGVPAAGWGTIKDSGYGKFDKEPKMYIGYATNTSKPSTDPRWSSGALENHVMECVHYNASYTTLFSFNQSRMRTKNTKVDYIKPLLEDGKSIAPGDEVYKEFAGFHALGYLFRTQLNGTIEKANDSTIGVGLTDVTQTDLLDAKTYLPSSPSSFTSEIQNLYNDLIMSMLANPDFVSVKNTTAHCTVSKTVQVWQYTPKYLILGYGLALLAATIALVLGFQAAFANAICMDVSFSSILVTTRNRSLDLLAEGCCLGQNPLPPEIRKTKLMFGEIGEALDGHVAHAAFGTLAEISPIVVGKKYV